MLVKVPEQGTLADVAAHRLAHSIVTGELAQGQKLNEAELAERFGMGRGPLREALRHLEGMRLVKRIPNAGARVVVLDRKTLAEDIAEIALAAESGALGIAHVLKGAGLVPSTSEAFRQLKQGAVKVDGARVEDGALAFPAGSVHVFQVGIRRLARVTIR